MIPSFSDLFNDLPVIDGNVLRRKKIKFRFGILRRKTPVDCTWVVLVEEKENENEKQVLGAKTENKFDQTQNIRTSTPKGMLLHRSAHHVPLRANCMPPLFAPTNLAFRNNLKKTAICTNAVKTITRTARTCRHAGITCASAV